MDRPNIISKIQVSLVEVLCITVYSVSAETILGNPHRRGRVRIGYFFNEYYQHLVKIWAKKLNLSLFQSAKNDCFHICSVRELENLREWNIYLFGKKNLVYDKQLIFMQLYSDAITQGRHLLSTPVEEVWWSGPFAVGLVYVQYDYEFKERGQLTAYYPEWKEYSTNRRFIQ